MLKDIYYVSDKKLNPEILDRYLAGEANGPEVEVVRSWMSGGEDRREVVSSLESALPGVQLAAPQLNIDKMWDRVRPAQAVRRRKHVWLYPTMGIAAAAVVAVLGLTNIRKIFSSSSPESKTYVTTTGQRATVTLADGSVAILAPRTTLQVQGRAVALSGEAVFTVTQHAGDPFIVKASGVETRVLGTTFGVRSYDKNVRVVVAEGRVSVAGATLSIGDAATVNGAGQPITEHDANIGALLGWTRGRLAFKSVPLKEVASDLERWYGLQISIQDHKLATEPVTAEFDNSSSETVVSALAEVLHARYERQGNKVTFTHIGS